MLIILMVGALILLWFGFPLWAYFAVRRLRIEVQVLQEEVVLLQRRPQPPFAPPAAAPLAAATPPPEPIVVVAPRPTFEPPTPPPGPVSASVSLPTVAVGSTPPPLPLREPAAPGEVPVSASHELPAPASSAWSKVDWEQFMGVKLISWLGGLAAFLGVAFGVKYSFEHDLVPKEIRAALGFLLSSGFLVAGLKLHRTRFAVTTQSLSATGIVSLYAVVFACRAFYQFPFFTPLPTFALMVLVTVTAFLLAVRMDARVVAVLGILGGFLTPILVSTGQDNPLGLFAYLGLLNLGLLAVAWDRRWAFLPPLGAAATVFMQVAWAERFLHTNSPEVTMGVVLAMLLVYAVGFAAATAGQRIQRSTTFSLAALALAGFGFCWYLALETPAGLAPWSLLGCLALVNGVLLGAAWYSPLAARFVPFSCGLVFALLAHWISARGAPALVLPSLAAILGFAALHSGWPLALLRRHPDAEPDRVGQFVPALGLALVLWGLVRPELASPWIWPAIFLLDALALVVAWLTASLLGVLLVLGLTLLSLTRWLDVVSPEILGLGALLTLAGGFAVLFSAVGLRLRKRFPSAGSADEMPAWLSDLLPVLGAVLPYLLLLLVALKVALPSPHAFFGLTVGLTALTLVVARALKSPWVPLCAVAGATLVCQAWVGLNAGGAAQPVLASAWLVGLILLLSAYPFASPVAAATQRLPWLASALGSVALFPSLYLLVRDRQLWPEEVLGALPLTVALLPLGLLLGVLRRPALEPSVALAQKAAFGGAVLFFITVAVPIQFSRQWLTVAWALEGTALLWLYHRLPHRGLGWTGLALLLVAFGRLALNPAVLAYHSTGYAPIFNWYLYTYGTVAVALVVAARLLAPPRDHWFFPSWPAKLQTLAGILLFLLLNLEIADFFAVPGSITLTFDFSGNFARDLSYTIGWALFALGVLIVGVWRGAPQVRYTALALLAVTLLKLFLHDLNHLGALYRIGALFAVALIAFAASLIYQRFVPHHEPGSTSRP